MADVYFLIEYPIYRDFETDDIDALASICTDEKFAARGVIFKEGAPADGLYIIKKGTVKVFKETQSRKKPIAILSEGEFFGEMALIDGSPRSATVEAGNSGAELVKLSNEGFARLKTEYSKTGFKTLGAIMKFMSYRIRRTTTKAAELIKGRKKKKNIKRQKK